MPTPFPRHSKIVPNKSSNFIMPICQVEVVGPILVKEHWGLEKLRFFPTHPYLFWDHHLHILTCHSDTFNKVSGFPLQFQFLAFRADLAGLPRNTKRVAVQPLCPYFLSFSCAFFWSMLFHSLDLKSSNYNPNGLRLIGGYFGKCSPYLPCCLWVMIIDPVASEVKQVTS